MKLLLGCVNSPISLIGYDWEKGEIFWSLEQEQLKVCGVSYDGHDLLVSSDNFITRLTPSGAFRIELTGEYESLAHSVRVIDDNLFGVADTGHSVIRIFNKTGEQVEILDPIGYWQDIPADAIHLNDFVLTPYGMLASCFDYRPWCLVRKETSWENWCSGGYGLIINLTGIGNKGMGRIVGCGFNHPHSLHYVDPCLYVCSSATGQFHRCKFIKGGLLVEDMHYKVTDDHFLRGAYKLDNGWFLGGSTVRHGEVLSRNMEIYYLNEISGEIEKKSIGIPGEIYDILPYKEDIMQSIIKKHFSPENDINLIKQTLR